MEILGFGLGGILLIIGLYLSYLTWMKGGKKYKVPAIALLVIGGVVLGGFAELGDKVGVDADALTIGGDTDTDTEDEITGAVDCPDDGITTLSWKIEDTLASTTTYMAGTDVIQVYDKTAGVIIVEDDSSASAYTTEDVTCGNTFILYGTNDADSVNVKDSVELVALGNTMYNILEGTDYGNLDVKVKDIEGDDWEAVSSDNDVANNDTTGVDLNTTLVYDTIAGGDMAVGSDGFLDLQIQLKTDSRKQFGDENNILCIDTNTGDEWDTSSIRVKVGSGSALSDMKDTIDGVSQDYSFIQDSEVCYKIGAINDVWKDVFVYVKAKASEDPDTSGDDLTLYVLPKGTYTSALNPETISSGYFSDDTTQLPVAYEAGEVPKLVFQIS